MYKQYYGMSHNPFEKDLDTKHAYVTQDMKAEYSRAAEPPVRCGESHLSGLAEPPVIYSYCI